MSRIIFTLRGTVMADERESRGGGGGQPFSVSPFKDAPQGASGYLYDTLTAQRDLVPTSDLGNLNSVRLIKSIIFCVGPSHRGAVCSRPSQDPRIKTGLVAPAGPPSFHSHPSNRDKRARWPMCRVQQILETRDSQHRRITQVVKCFSGPS